MARPLDEVVTLLAAAGGPAGAADSAVRGYALPVGPGHTVIYPDPETDATALAGPLSRLLEAPALGTYVYDSDVLLMTVYAEGEPTHHYDSCPGYFDAAEGDLGDSEDRESPVPVGADPDAFVPLAFGPVDRPALRAVLLGIPLDPGDGENGRYVFANTQHYDAMTCLGLNACRLSTGYHYLSLGGLPHETSAEELVLLGGRMWPAEESAGRG
ncbi:hypothetical protein [Streptomyces cylindrosporus]|uniref:Uncharacterized protein n=1 Tax=Streptomyces cylindrosporus TaxID=2927583 RepID=A0ABS9Y689_9ACTN|nr:hypothetical protein [Streptomyces cylindrosporus]MCI3272171.1 hypothetical protein [Streptomyces cylindrosporus]